MLYSFVQEEIQTAWSDAFEKVVGKKIIEI
jgi:hypothetical protein